MYRLSPYTYLIEGLLGQAIGKQEVNCAAVEFVTITPPSGMTCAGYMDSYISAAGGYLSNPDATSACQFCSVRTTDQFLGLTFNIFYDHHWRNFGIMVAFVFFNVRRFCPTRCTSSQADFFAGLPRLLSDLHLPHPQRKLPSFV